jgi:beclin 1
VPVFTNREPDFDSQVDSLDHYVPAFRWTDSKTGSNGFMLIDQKGDIDQVGLGNQLKKTAGLFDLLSSNSDVDHPLCEECCDCLLDSMDQQLKLTDEELNDYSNFLKKLESEKEDDSLEDLEKELNTV